ncbi:hypothetical protein PSTEL_00550 [Paenibacillus stellifer]|uniref:Uncharacterized protein n=1 Tax=Paenibacillus stellifer TaxID=169760 RepID=A0A089LLS6_9BACL|nr:hypothetical protein [Paenibacillus stellifer]AIQ61842.1 hypothetical protein PSTEL_00550 [Paenibacillus stellifer]
MKLIAKCFTCGKEYDIGKWSAHKNGVRCDAPGCDGFVISPSGKVQFKIEGEIEPGEPTLQLVEEGDNQ